MRISTAIALLILIGLGIGIYYAWSEYSRKNISLVNVKPAYNVDAEPFIQEFVKEDSVAEKKYLGKTISVKGKVKNVEQEEGGNITLVLGNASEMSSIRCALDSSNSISGKNVKTGQEIIIKGIFTGYQKDDTGLLGSDIIFNRCVISPPGNK